MTEYDKADLDVIGMVNENRRRSKITTTIGYIATQEQSIEYAVMKAAQKRGGIGYKGIALMCIAVMTIICIPVVALICEIIK